MKLLFIPFPTLLAFVACGNHVIVLEVGIGPAAGNKNNK